MWKLETNTGEIWCYEDNEHEDAKIDCGFSAVTYIMKKVRCGNMKPLYFVSRNHNLYIVAKTACNHYYIALTLGGKRIASWKRMSKCFIKSHFENYIDTCDNLKIYLYDKGVTF